MSESVFFSVIQSLLQLNSCNSGPSYVLYSNYIPKPEFSISNFVHTAGYSYTPRSLDLRPELCAFTRPHAYQLRVSFSPTCRHLSPASHGKHVAVCRVQTRSLFRESASRAPSTTQSKFSLVLGFYHSLTPATNPMASSSASGSLSKALVTATFLISHTSSLLPNFLLLSSSRCK